MTPQDTQPTALKSRLRWYQYRLRTLLVFVTLCAVACSCATVIRARLAAFKTAKQEFFDSIPRDDIVTVQALLRQHPSLIQADSPMLRVPGGFSVYTNGETPLSVAVMYESKDTFEYLLSLHPDVNAAGEAKSPPLIWAVCAKDIVYLKTLLDNGADASVRDFNGKTASDYAKQFKKDEFLKLIASRHYE
jgi:hypothetical protein